MKTFGQFSEAIRADSSFVPAVLNLIKDKTVARDLGSFEIAEILNDAFGRHDIVFKPGFGQSDDRDLAEAYLIRASCRSDGLITIEYEDGLWEQFEDESSWSNFVGAVEKIVKHELVHRHQFRKLAMRHYGYQLDQILRRMEQDPVNTTSYLSGKHEIAAFAHQAVFEFRKLGYSDEAIRRFLRNPYDRDGAPGREETTGTWVYTEWFEKNDPILKQFFYQMAKSLDPHFS